MKEILFFSVNRSIRCTLEYIWWVCWCYNKWKAQPDNRSFEWNKIDFYWNILWDIVGAIVLIYACRCNCCCCCCSCDYSCFSYMLQLDELLHVFIAIGTMISDRIKTIIEAAELPCSCCINSVRRLSDLCECVYAHIINGVEFYYCMTSFSFIHFLPFQRNR